MVRPSSSVTGRYARYVFRNGLYGIQIKRNGSPLRPVTFRYGGRNGVTGRNVVRNGLPLRDNLV